MRGRLPARTGATFVGGCLSLVTPLTTSRYTKRIDPRNRWIVLEDLDEQPHRIDRQLAHIKLAGWFDRCAGVLIGDFHLGDKDQTKTVLNMLPYHLPARRNVPIIVTKRVGHVWPLAPLPIRRQVTLETGKTGRVRFNW